ncbi:type II toxin-antitoxin system VapC family toxin [Iningainema tapete]|uniref:Ribonuclease VapC n=1 Tax=Iningainema tapete BLCC-T55 TaxID=2748662 RepID=A0A8J7C0F9_9CYAN|nr:type II toxin-antitoxin system VapC family toxin [Iningainema tapete]MBD2777963.1 type II toxin-antitoxin system VapC family toxin [Iningainema tapete BLCC-T55]
MSGRFLLDTNIVIALFEEDVSVQEKLAQANQVFISSTVVGELYYGAYRSRRVAANIARIEEFTNSNTVLPCDLVTSQFYGQIKNFLKLKGRPIPENDIWIAAIAQQYKLILVSRDQHFMEIDRLTVETW